MEALLTPQVLAIVGTIFGGIIAAVGAYYVAKRHSASSYETALHVAGKEIREELRVDLRDQKNENKNLEVRVHAIQMELENTKGQLQVVKHLRCTMPGCPVFHQVQKDKNQGVSTLVQMG